MDTESDNLTIEIEPNKDNDTNSARYQCLLKLLNGILLNINKQTIKTIEEFASIDREDIIQDKNYIYLLEIQKDLFKKGRFTKTSTAWSRHTKSKTTNYIMTFLRYACAQIGYEFNYVKKDKCDIVSGKSYRRTHYLYSIKKHI
ncbi:MAG: hypothetical protein Hyperionvirus11_46 [Hyperionvirus sp.]|uniref:Uncharacterized protein n=1 Tax=Hyperionvirus sp. TaxID=2487770 RepID=A0A3G5AD05_9VIRU|nr:MAG: hypothetical protein Hyperionvirus11_46 [Hyperionvirus sp.]